MGQREPIRLTRRDFMCLSVLATAAPGLIDTATTARAPVTLRKYADPLPIPPIATPSPSRYPGADFYELTVEQRSWRFHRDLPPAPAWGYWAADPNDPTGAIGMGYLGPTLVAERGRPVIVRYRNRLPDVHLLQSAFDPTLWRNLAGAPPDPAGGRMPHDFPIDTSVWHVTHLHGGFVTPQSDGGPETWVTSRGVRGPRFATLAGAGVGDFIFAYPTDQRATMLWYHDHAMALTRLNVYAGLAGAYLIRDPVERALALPRGDFEIPLIVQDRRFNADGSLHYPAKGQTTYHPQWVPEFFGDVPVVNGKAYPYLAVEPRRYRFRVLNGSNSRFYRLALTAGDTGLPFWLIGMDQGLRAAPLPSTSVTLAPAERADMIIDFIGIPEGTEITLTNDAPAPFPKGGGGPSLPEILQFRVAKPLSSPDRTARPDTLALPPITPLRDSRDVRRREFVLTEITDPAGNPIHTMINQRFFFESIEDSVRAGTTEIWEYVNTTGDSHPMHVHLLKFQVLNRQRFDNAAYLGDFDRWLARGRRPEEKPRLAKYLRGRPIPPAPEETGWKDTFKADPHAVNRVIAVFETPGPVAGIAGTEMPSPGIYVHHCHMLEHEDNEMMRPWQVVAS